ncbi:MAG: hypothetical protein JNG86_07145 [Verrucomicrobiaceae bacterium]|nr:hypothetical protein [Verrucomicrobiaceae bacterium]
MPRSRDPPGVKLTRKEWHARRTAHLERVSALADAFVARRSRGAKHPVEDFLFTYYSVSPAKLKQWVPPLGTVIEVVDEDVATCPWLCEARFECAGGGLWLRDDTMTPHQRTLAGWITQLCTAVEARPARFRCFGLHEWAMVYQQTAEQVRHQGHELRLPAEELARFVESQALCCTHYDAFRFFTPEARPLNAFQPVLETRLEMEQGGCLHTNMDLYKWSAKLLPWIGSDLVGECFAHAWRGRRLDMRASPYDLRTLGYEPVCIETAEGRAVYEEEQRGLAEEAARLRARLREAAALLAG